MSTYERRRFSLKTLYKQELRSFIVLTRFNSISRILHDQFIRAYVYVWKQGYHTNRWWGEMNSSNFYAWILQQKKMDMGREALKPIQIYDEKLLFVWMMIDPVIQITLGRYFTGQQILLAYLQIYLQMFIIWQFDSFYCYVHAFFFTSDHMSLRLFKVTAVELKRWQAGPSSSWGISSWWRRRRRRWRWFWWSWQWWGWWRWWHFMASWTILLMGKILIMGSIIEMKKTLTKKMMMVLAMARMGRVTMRH